MFATATPSGRAWTFRLTRGGKAAIFSEDRPFLGSRWFILKVWRDFGFHCELSIEMEQDNLHEMMGRGTLPGSDLIAAGIEDLSRGVHSIPALLVSIGAPRLQRLGFQAPNPIPEPERRLYDLLRQADPDAAHSRYNALIRRLVSFEHAAECVK
jgi:hypothetical protein